MMIKVRAYINRKTRIRRSYVDKMKAFILVLVLFASSLVDVQASSSICIGVPSGVTYLVPYPGDCSRYYACLNGVATPESCPNGEWFNEAVQTCDHPANSGCSTFICPPGVVDYFPYPGDCTQYIECFNGFPEHHLCPNGLWFNAYEKRCVYAPQSGCGSWATSVQPTWTTPSECYGVLPGSILLKPYPGICSMYIECYGAQEAIRSCPPGLWFDEQRQMCDIPALSDCVYGNPTPAPPNSYDDPRCVNGNNEYWPDVDCNKFVECYGGHGYELNCPSGLYFDSEHKVCLDPSVADCGRTVAPPPATSPGWSPDPFCPWPSYDRYLFPYPGDCTRFIVCYYGERTVEECPPSLWFNPVLLVCDYPYEAGCYPYPLDEEV